MSLSRSTESSIDGLVMSRTASLSTTHACHSGSLFSSLKFIKCDLEKAEKLGSDLDQAFSSHQVSQICHLLVRFDRDRVVTKINGCPYDAF
jgi:hypothetical protein